MRKTLVLFCVILLLLQTACAKDSGRVESSSAGETLSGGEEVHVLKLAPEDRSQTLNCADFFETAEGYYFGCGNFVYFCPRGGNKFQTLCSKPNCKHVNEANPEDCDAYMEGNFGFYDGAIYGIKELNEVELALIRMELDGTGHQQVASFRFDDHRMERCSYSTVFHHGKLYIQWMACADIPMEEAQDYLTVVNLSDYSCRDILEDYLQTARLPYFWVFYKDKLYGDGTEKQQYDCEPDDIHWFELDTNSEKLRTLLPVYHFNSYDAGISTINVTDSTLYYYEYLSNQGEFEDAAEMYVPGFREYDLKTGEIRDCGNPSGIDDVVCAHYDDDYIYASSFVHNEHGDRIIYFLSRDYKLLDQIEMKDGMEFVAITSDRIFFSGNGMPIGYYMNKSQIGTHDMSLKTMEMLDVKMDYGE